jgi:phenylacetate-CoA ligase
MNGIGDFARLQAAIRRAWRVSDFHRRHWRDGGVPDGWVPAAPDELERLPVVTKQDLLAAQAVDPPWGGNLCIDERDIAQVHLTTGTSGIGQERYACSAADVHVMGQSWDRQYQAIGLERGDVALLTIPVSFFCAGLSALEGARIHGLVPVLTGVASKDLMLDLLSQHRVSYLYGVESLLLQLANLARERGLAGRFAGQLKGIQSVGTSPQLLQAAAEVFQAPVFEVYGCTQAAAKIANTCHLGVEQGSNHFHPEHLYIETRDPHTGAFVDEGEAELIISTPYREACPVIRFALRDKVELVPAGGCACGDPRPGFRPGSLGRLDSMMKIRGVNVWPQQLEQLLLGHPGVRDFRAEVRRGGDGADELLLRVACGQHIEHGVLIEALTLKVREHTMVRPRIQIADALDETTGQYKVRRFSDLRKALDDAAASGVTA